MTEIENPDVGQVFEGYPDSMRRKMLRLRQIILDTASETEGGNAVNETLKWGEPSYINEGRQYRQDRLESKNAGSVRDVL